MLISLRPCKHRKIKCGEEKPGCLNCERNGEKCDYSIVLNWQGRNKKGGSPGNNMLGASSFSTIQYSPGTKPRMPQQLEESQQRTTQHTSFDSNRCALPKREYRGAFSDYSGPSLDSPSSNDFDQSPPRSAGLPSVRTLDPSLSRIRAQSAESYPSPAETSIGSPPGSGFSNARSTMLHPSSSSDPMPPPIPSHPYQQLPPLPGAAGHSRQPSAEDHRSKRMRLSPATESFEHQPQQQSYNAGNYFSTPNYTSRPRPPGLGPFTSCSPSNGVPRIPPTPAASIGSEDNQNLHAKPSPQQLDSPSTRRVSIQSLVSGTSPAESPGESGFHGRLSDTTSSISEKKTYGFDHGLPDLDIPNNKDNDALSPYTPKTIEASPYGLNGEELDFNIDENYPEFGFLLDAPTEIQQQTQQEVKSYYTSRPIKVEISTSLGTLPYELQSNQMNLLYFHHFVDHTARILVPYDCSENPFKTILPKSMYPHPSFSNELLIPLSSGFARRYTSPPVACLFCQTQISAPQAS